MKKLIYNFTEKARIGGSSLMRSMTSVIQRVMALFYLWLILESSLG